MHLWHVVLWLVTFTNFCQQLQIFKLIRKVERLEKEVE